MMLDELKCVTPNPIAHMSIRIAKKVYTAEFGMIYTICRLIVQIWIA